MRGEPDGWAEDAGKSGQLACAHAGLEAGHFVALVGAQLDEGPGIAALQARRRADPPAVGFCAAGHGGCEGWGVSKAIRGGPQTCPMSDESSFQVVHNGTVVAVNAARGVAHIRVGDVYRYSRVVLPFDWLPHVDQEVRGALETLGPVVLRLPDGFLVEVRVEAVNCSLATGYESTR